MDSVSTQHPVIAGGCQGSTYWILESGEWNCSPLSHLFQTPRELSLRVSRFPDSSGALVSFVLKGLPLTATKKDFPCVAKPCSHLLTQNGAARLASDKLCVFPPESIAGAEQETVGLGSLRWLSCAFVFGWSGLENSSPRQFSPVPSPSPKKRECLPKRSWQNLPLVDELLLRRLKPSGTCTVSIGEPHSAGAPTFKGWGDFAPITLN